MLFNRGNDFPRARDGVGRVWKVQINNHEQKCQKVSEAC
jgi:hypothetical protein